VDWRATTLPGMSGYSLTGWPYRWTIQPHQPRPRHPVAGQPGLGGILADHVTTAGNLPRRPDCNTGKSVGGTAGQAGLDRALR